MWKWLTLLLALALSPVLQAASSDCTRSGLMALHVKFLETDWCLDLNVACPFVLVLSSLSSPVFWVVACPTAFLASWLFLPWVDFSSPGCWTWLLGSYSLGVDFVVCRLLLFWGLLFSSLGAWDASPPFASWLLLGRPFWVLEALLLLAGSALSLAVLLCLLHGGLRFPRLRSLPSSCHPCRRVGLVRRHGPRKGWIHRLHSRCGLTNGCVKRNAFLSRCGACLLGWVRQLKAGYFSGLSLIRARPTLRQRPKLNTCLKGGTNKDTALLIGLQNLLAAFSDSTQLSQEQSKGLGTRKGKPGPVPPTPGKGGSFKTTPKGNRDPSKGQPKGKGNKTGHFPETDSKNDNEERSLLDALCTLTQRAQKNPHNLLQRIQRIVEAAVAGKRLKGKNKAGKQQPSVQTKGKGYGTIKTPGPPPTGKGAGKTKNSGRKTPPETKAVGQPVLWSEVVKRKQQHDPHGRVPSKKPWTLLPSAFAEGRIVSETALRNSLEKGECPKDVIVWTTEASVPHLQNLAKVHSIDGRTKVSLLIESKPELTISGGQELSLPVHNGLAHGLNHFRAFPLLNELSTLPSVTLKSAAPKVSRDLACFRITMAQELVGPDVWKDAIKNPLKLVRSFVPSKAFHSSFGWTQNVFQNRNGHQETLLQGFLKVDAVHFMEVAALSGTKGWFLQRIHKEDLRPLAVEWIPKNEQENHHQYFARATQISTSQKRPLAFRRGGGSSLGIRGTAVGPTELRLWCAAGIPRHWKPEDVEKCLEQAGCVQTTIISPPRQGSTWILKTKAPNGDAATPVVGIETAEGTILLTKAPPKKAKQLDSKKIRPGTWSSKVMPAPQEVAPTQLDSTQKDNDSQEAPAKRPKTTQEHPYTVLDCGGNGNCGWHSVAAGLLIINKQSSVEDAQKAAPVQAKTLRCDIHAHVCKHSADYQPFWAFDPSSTPEMDAGETPQDFKSWIPTLLRDKQWICGLALKAIAKRCGVKIVVVKFESDDTPLEPKAFGKSKRDQQPIILKLKDQHYQLLLPKDGFNFPSEWINCRDDGDPPDGLKGAGKAWDTATPTASSKVSSCKTVRKRGWAVHTPKSQATSKRLCARTSEDSTSNRITPSAAASKTTKGQDGQKLSCSSKPPGSLVTVSEAELLQRPWWTCQLCNFQIFVTKRDGKFSQAHFGERRRHLQRAHGVSDPPKLPRNGINNQSVKQEAQRQAQNNIRWKAVWEQYQKDRWPGSHSLNFQGFKQNKCWFQSCADCGRRFHRSIIWNLARCPKSNVHGAWPEAQARRQLWKKFIQAGAQALKAQRKVRYTRAMTVKESAHQAREVYSTQRRAQKQRVALGRAERQGEASNPGPKSTDLNVWSVNIRSWNKHGSALCELAFEKHVHVICCQEINLTANHEIAAKNQAYRAGWNMYTQLNSEFNGGVAILVRQPCAATITASFNSVAGQILLVDVHLNDFSSSSSIPVCTFYRRPEWKDSLLEELIPFLLSIKHKPFVAGGDWNSSVHTGELNQIMQEFGADLGAFARHDRSSEPIDGIWLHSRLKSQSSGKELPSVGNDHSIASVTIKNFFKNDPASTQECKLRPRLRSCLGPELSYEAKVDCWNRAATDQRAWKQLLAGNVNTLWKTWVRDLEKFLTATGHFKKTGRRCIGTEPKPECAGHSVAPGQTHAERCIRRKVRRVKEILLCCRTGRLVPPDLLLNLRKSLTNEEHRRSFECQAWGELHNALLSDLNTLHTRKTQETVAVWKHSMKDYSKAVKWAKQKAPVPHLLRKLDGSYAAGKPACLEALAELWRPIFYGPPSYEPDVQAYLNQYQGFLPHKQNQEKPTPLSAATLRCAAADMQGKAAGPDGLSFEHLLFMPTVGWERLAEVIGEFERQSEWPSEVTHWRINFIPKDQSCAIDKMRPLAIGPAAYRLWAKCRVKEASIALGPSLGPNQASGTGSIDCETIHAALNTDFAGSQFGFGLTLDYTKAFDSCDHKLAIELFRRAGVHPQTCALLQNQWNKQKRWLSCGGALYPKVWTECPALLQGDPFAPLALAAILTSPLKHSQTENVHQFLYLDDRTLISTDENLLWACHDTWESLAQVTRLRTNHTKTQFWGRNQNARDHLNNVPGRIAPSNGAEVLGTVLDYVGEEPHAKEVLRFQAGKKIAMRINILPIHRGEKTKLATTLISPLIVWGTLLNGRRLGDLPKNFHQLLKGCVCGNLSNENQQNSRASPHLTDVFVLGHCCDLNFIASCRVLGALVRWLRWSRPGPQDAAVPNSFKPLLSVLNKKFSSWGWTTPRPGQWRTSNQDQVSLFATKEEQLFDFHKLRQSWRRTKICQWIRSDRIDAQVAQEAGLLGNITDELVSKLRQIAKGLDVHSLAVMTGGTRSEASIVWDTELDRTVCPDCSKAVVPCLEHIFWKCPTYQVHRRVPKPACPLAQRLGWSHRLTKAESKELLTQMGTIREAELRNRMRRFRPRFDLRGGAATLQTLSFTSCYGDDAAAATARKLTPCTDFSSHRMFFNLHQGFSSPLPRVIRTFADQIEKFLKSRAWATWFAFAWCLKLWKEGPQKDARKTHRGKKIEMWKPSLTVEQGVTCTFEEDFEKLQKSRAWKAT